jgi:dienelactone hydrolase
VDLDAHAARLAPHLTVLKPAGEGPFPVCVQLHGCGGIKPMQHRYAEALRAAGVAAVIVDSFTPRGIGAAEARATVCTGLRLRGGERAADLAAVLHWVERQPWADTDRLAAAGWSHGAWAIMDALAGAAAAPLPLKTVVLFYPYAGPLSRTRMHGWGANRPNVYACYGGRDAVVGRALPERALRRLEGDGLAVEALFLPEATHCFDEEGAIDPRNRYRPDLEAQARAFLVRGIEGTLLARTPVSRPAS